MEAGVEAEAGVKKDGVCGSDGKVIALSGRKAGGTSASRAGHAAKGVDGGIPDATILRTPDPGPRTPDTVHRAPGTGHRAAGRGPVVLNRPAGRRR
ncbi:hypothetical protein DDQ41_10715 [Streptomyces spongiicola]|uniref:Transposase IS701-like DDE domain-containing protein n=1 Tax=Streptomyces spongiicola TaxID=1690221 RepID=A0ABN5KG27_9ACTN|nr:hypothetical protein DDQ41_10715 [Streptomyces spongiicola]